jgi:hypothetical protein
MSPRGLVRETHHGSWITIAFQRMCTTQRLGLPVPCTDTSLVMAKRRTLPKDFEALLATGDLERLKAVFETCDVNARGGFYKHTALAFPTCPDELARWLVSRGTDVHATDSSDRTALHVRASWHTGSLEALCELGCDVNANAKLSDGTPLHQAALGHVAKHVATLLAHGAHVDATNSRGQTALEVALESCSNTDLAETAEIVRLLLAQGAAKPTSANVALRKLGERFQFHQAAMDEDFATRCREALAALDAAFAAAPVPPRRMHDGSTDIVAPSGTWQEQHRELWNLLVPSSGAAATVQGEVIRIAGRIADELERNGGVNWDDDYRRMAHALVRYVQTGTPLPPTLLAELGEVAAAVLRTIDADVDRLAELAVAWVNLNPRPIPLAKPEYAR